MLKSISSPRLVCVTSLVTLFLGWSAFSATGQDQSPIQIPDRFGQAVDNDGVAVNDARHLIFPDEVAVVRLDLKNQGKDANEQNKDRSNNRGSSHGNSFLL